MQGGGLGFKKSNLLLPALQSGVHYLQGSGKDNLVALVGACHHISALLADGGEHLAGHPMLESLGTL